MGQDTKITDFHHTFNPWWGCYQIAAGCDNCFAKGFAHRMRWDVWGKMKYRRMFGEDHWKAPQKWNRIAGKSDKPCYVLCGSMCDIFEIHALTTYERLDLRPEREKLWSLIDQTPHLTWMLLTKRPGNIEALLPWRWCRGNRGELPANVWLGYSAATQHDLDAGWPLMESLGYYAHAPLFLSLEPLIEDIDVAGWLVDDVAVGDEHFYERGSKGINWVRLGGESGRTNKTVRTMRLDWARHVLAQCAEYEVPAYVSQLGSAQAKEMLLLDWKGADAAEWPAELRVQQFPGHQF